MIISGESSPTLSAHEGQSRPKRLAVLCDGTWCGRETGTTSNIELLAEKIGIAVDSTVARAHDQPYTVDDPQRGVKGAYFEGIGLGKTFMEYIFDGATARTIDEECISAYQYIVENYDPSYEIWMFGLSRGAYTVRCVAGMINNCGIIRRRSDPAQTRTLCQEVYKIYRSPYDIDKPDSAQSKAFRANKDAVWQAKTPIKFLGLLDTVGSLGIPRVDAGIPGGFDYPEFHDQNVSSEVEKVYHALALHDRLWAFAPCFVSRKEGAVEKNPSLEIVEKWFPGCHYDLGRQRFRFLRKSSNILETLLSYIPDRLSQTVYPNEVLSDLVLRWMLESIRHVDSQGTLIPRVESEINNLTKRIEKGSTLTGSGDVYGNMLPFAPFGNVWAAVGALSEHAVSFLDKITPKTQLGTAIEETLGLKTIMRILLATRDRRISDREAKIDLYTEPFRAGERSVAQSGDITSKRYPSRTYQSYWLWKLVLGGITQEAYARFNAN